jgi:hypothetical protein
MMTMIKEKEMKNLAIIFSLIILSLFSANCGAKAEKTETKPTNPVSNTAASNAPQLNTSTTAARDNDGDADDVRVNNSNSNSTANVTNKRVDADDVRGKDADDIGGKDADDVRKSQNSNVNKKVKDRDDLNKKGDADDKGKRRDSDGDDDDY